MKISYNWLCDILPGLKKFTPRQLADRLTLSGLEVEDVQDLSAPYTGIVVGAVLEKAAHPNADHLSVCRVSAGGKEYQIVCGAQNVRVGGKYPLAPVGAVMPDGKEIQEVSLRGVHSSGMLCSAKELMISEDRHGLLELPTESRVGGPFARAYRLDDSILEVNVTPNRGDALSHWGVARDLAAATGLTVKADVVFPPDIKATLPQTKRPLAACAVKIVHRDKKACPRFTASQVNGVTIAPSPLWLARRLENLGVRSINNVVDATNYVMLLTGHPVHAYDARQIAGRTIVVSSVKQNTLFKTLDGVERKLARGDLVIGDANGPVGLAGIMGGENSEIRDDTRDVILEVAHFGPDVIRKTARRLGIQTESSYRFERFVNPQTVLRAHEILRDLIVTLCGGTPTAIVDSYAQKWRATRIRLADAEITRLLGIAVDRKDVMKIFAKLDCRCRRLPGGYEIVPPAARSDLMRPIDLIEEIARIHGLEKILAALPLLPARCPAETPVSRIERDVKEFFVAQGFCETLHYSFGDAGFFRQVLRPENEIGWVTLDNPISADLAVMRPSLLPGLLECYLKNHLLSERGLRLFELRRVYSAGPGDKIVERTVLAALYGGNPLGRNRFGAVRVSDFFDGKGLIELLCRRARLATAERRHTQWPFHPGQALEFLHDGKRLAVVGSLHPELLLALKIREQLCYVEIDFDVLAKIYQTSPVTYRPVSSLPAVQRDLSVLVPLEINYRDIITFIVEEKPRYLKNVELFDLYQGEGLPENKKSLAFSMIYEPDSISLTDEEVNAVHFALVERLKEKLRLELR